MVHDKKLSFQDKDIPILYFYFRDYGILYTSLLEKDIFSKNIFFFSRSTGSYPFINLYNTI